MGTKICFQSTEPVQEEIQKEVGIIRKSMIDGAIRVAREDTEIVFHEVKQSPCVINYAYLEMLKSVCVVDGVLEAEKQGFDAAIIACGNDNGLREARQVVDIPVVGPTEAAMLLACTMGYKFGVITVGDMAHTWEDNIRNYGLSQRAIFPIRVYNLGDDPMKHAYDMVVNPGKIMPQFEELCHACIADGAEVIIPACCTLGPATTLLGYKEVPGTGVPVIDVVQAAVKFAEMLVDLKHTVGLGKYKKPFLNQR